MQFARRKFLKIITFGTATSVIAGKLWQREVMAYCENQPGQKDAVFKVRLSDYPALQSEFGSVRLGINPVTSENPLDDGRFYPLIITRGGFNDFYALDAECRHARCVLPAYDRDEFKIICGCHGSWYDVDGTVLQGPAQQPLYRYTSEYDGDNTLTIHIPCWGFETTATVLPGGPTSRLKLDFDGKKEVTYEVSFSQSPKGPWTPASFATTPGGAANQTELTPPASGPVSIYLDRSTATGFYAVGMKLSET
jgi:Rieske Fe-S protein